MQYRPKVKQETVKEPVAAEIKAEEPVKQTSTEEER